MRRKLLLPALAACAMLAVSAPVAPAKSHKAHAASVGKRLSQARGAIKGLQKALSLLGDINAGQTAAINRNGAGITDTQSVLGGLQTSVAAITSAATSALTQLQAGLVAVGAGLTKLAATVDSSLVARPTIVVAQVFAGSPVAANAIRGCFVATPHIPYHGNVATSTISCPVVQIQTNPNLGENAPAAGGALTVLASCRTAKTNVNLAGGKPCALAGIANLMTSPLGAAPATFLTSKPNAGLGGAPFYPMDANKLFSKDPTQAAFPLSLSTGGTDTVDDPAKLLDLTSGTIATAPAGAPTLGTCVGGATPCLSTVTLTLRAVDSNAQLPPN